MHIVGLLLAAIGGLAYWYFRYHQSREMIDDAVDMVGRAKGAYKRKKFRNKAEASVLASLDDPVQAVTVLLVGLAEAVTPMTNETEAGIKFLLEKTTGTDNTDEHLAFAKWACREVPDLHQVIRRLAPLWNKMLDEHEKLEIVEMANQVIDLSGSPAPVQREAVFRLRRELNLPQPDGSY